MSAAITPVLRNCPSSDSTYFSPARLKTSNSASSTTLLLLRSQLATSSLPAKPSQPPSFPNAALPIITPAASEASTQASRSFLAACTSAVSRSSDSAITPREPDACEDKKNFTRNIILQQNSLARHWARDWRALALTQVHHGSRLSDSWTKRIREGIKLILCDLFDNKLFVRFSDTFLLLPQRRLEGAHRRRHFLLGRVERRHEPYALPALLLAVLGRAADLAESPDQRVAPRCARQREEELVRLHGVLPAERSCLRRTINCCSHLYH